MSERLAWTGLVLASGRSRRFGGLDKGRLPLGGRTLLQRVVDALTPVTATCLVVGPHAPEGVAHVRDEDVDGGPIAGLRAGLRAIDTPYAIVAACDLPFLTPAFLGALQAEGRHTDLAYVEGRDGTAALCLTARRTILSMLDAYWEAGGRRLQEVVQRLPHVVLPDATRARHDPAGLLLLNVNDPLTYARALAEARHDCRASYFTDLDESKHTP